MQKRFNTLLAPENRGGNLRPVSGASVTVTDPNGALATIYSDNGVTEAANPLTSNATGDYEYYAADGRYTETIVKAGRDTVTISDILLEDPADSPAPTSADIASTADSKGAGLVGFSALAEYAAGTVGKFLKDLVSSAGASLVGYESALGDSTTVSAALTSAHPSTRKTLGDVIEKAHGGAAITIACYGDSITYGQDTSGSGVATQINGASQTRSVYPYPETLAESLAFAGFSGGVTVHNRGYPGDSTVQGLSRWASASATDLSFIMYGHNDANNYGGNGIVSLADYRLNLAKIIEREFDKGAAVVVLGPPPTNSMSGTEKIRAYSQAAREVARKYGLTFIDMADQISGITSYWYDGTHLTSFGYAEMGWHLAGLLVKRDGAMTRATEGDIYYPDDAIGHGGSFYNQADAKGNGRLIQLTPGQTYAVAVDCLTDVLPVLHSYCGAGATRSIRMYYAAGTLGGVRGVSYSELAHNPTYGIRQSLVGCVLKKGLRTIYLRNDGTENAYIEALEFVGKDHLTVSRGLAFKSNALSGAFQPARNVGPSWWAAADHGVKLKAPFNITAKVTLSDTYPNGLALWRDKPIGTNEYFGNNAMYVLRTGTSLVIRELVSGALAADTTAAAVFSAGVFSGEIELVLTTTSADVYVDGVLKASRPNPANTEGHPGLLSDKSARIVCQGLTYQGHVKGPY